MPPERDLIAELIRLRRGWGLQSRNLRTRIGPQLIRLSGIGSADGDREIRDKVRLLLQSTIADLPTELAHVARIAFALDHGYQHRRLTQRVEALAGEQSWAPRTARRRIDHAVRLMAEAALRYPVSDEVDRVAEAPPPVATLCLDASPRGGHAPQPVVLRVPVPRDRFDLLIRFEVAGGA